MIVRVNSQYPSEEIIDFCNSALDKKRPGTINLVTEDWENKPHTLLYALYKEKRYDGDRSGYLVCKEGGKIVAGFGWSPCFIDPQMYCLSRGFSLKSTLKFYRLLFAISDFAFYSQYKGGVMTFESHNYDFMNRLVKLQADHTVDPYYEKEIVCGRVFRHTYKKQKTRCLPLTPYENLVNYRYCKQRIAYHLFDPDYEKHYLRRLRLCHAQTT